MTPDRCSEKQHDPALFQCAKRAGGDMTEGIECGDGTTRGRWSRALGEWVDDAIPAKGIETRSAETPQSDSARRVRARSRSDLPK